jgi:TonB family protein
MIPELSVLKASIVFASGIIIFLCSGKLAPAVRHGLCALALALGILTSLTACLPSLSAPVVFKIVSGSGHITDLSRPDTAQYLALVWAAGAIVVVARFFFGVLFLWNRSRKLERFGEMAGVEVRLAPVSTPFVWGWLRPVVLLPLDAGEWPAERRRLALTHELAHVKRRDNWTALLALFAQALYWFHPLVWWLAARLREQQELACDDRVLASGAEPGAYAEFLVEMARQLSSTALFGCAMVSSSKNLRGRIMNILCAHNKRGPSFGNRLARIILPGLLVAGAIALPAFKINLLSAATENSQVYKIGGDVTAPRLVYKSEPQYTKEAREKKIEGTTVLRLTIDNSGLPGAFTIVRGLDDGLDQEAIEAVEQWRFLPATKAGEPVAVEATIEVNWKLK